MQEIEYNPVMAAVNDILHRCAEAMKLYASIESKKLEVAAILCNVHSFTDAEGNKLSGQAKYQEARKLAERVLKDPIAAIPSSLFGVLNIDAGKK